MKSPYGAAIERGVITEVCDGGYRVSSYSRKGITTPAIPSIDGRDYQAGNRVYFFMFDDGHGAILAAF